MVNAVFKKTFKVSLIVLTSDDNEIDKEYRFVRPIFHFTSLKIKKCRTCDIMQTILAAERVNHTNVDKTLLQKRY